MNIRLFSVVFAAVGSLALAACTINTTDGTGGAGGGGGDPSTSSSTASAGGAGGTGTTGTGGSGGAGACETCGAVITNNTAPNTCMGTSTDAYNALNACACDPTKCEMQCANGAMCAVYAGMAPSTDCLTCIQAQCQNEFNTCANDL